VAVGYGKKLFYFAHGFVPSGEVMGITKHLGRIF